MTLTDQQKEVLLQASRGEIRWDRRRWVDPVGKTVSSEISQLIAWGLIEPGRSTLRLTEDGWETKI